MVLGGRAHHAGAADINILDDLVALGALGDGRGKGIEVDHDQIDRADAVRVHCGDMLCIVAHREQTAMHHRVQRLDAAVHHLGKVGDLRNVAHRKARIAQRLGGAAGGDQLHAMRRQSGAEFGQAAFVGDGKQRALDRNVGHVIIPYA